jgi:hypothetical protein
MLTATIQILGKEAGALRKRPPEELEDRVALPCTLNGQIASGEVNRYRFEASKGQRLVISTLARQLIPFVADAVPGWFQPVVVVYDAQGRELAYADDYRFMPDPVIVFEVPRDGEYVCEVKDSLYRGREDFVYRLTIGELPFVTSVFPLGGQVGAARLPAMQGVNLIDADLTSAWNGKVPGIWPLAASRLGYESNRVPFALDRLRDEFEQPDLPAGAAQRVELPVVINGRIDRPDDWDVYEFTASAGQAIVAEVQARRLDSPLDSVLKLTDAAGRVIAFNDDREDLTAGLNTHHADSYLMAKLPAAGAYRLHIGDTARQGGEEYGYRLRLGPPQPDFDLRVVPTSVSLPAGSTTALTIFAVRRDGFNGPIKLALKEAVGGITAAPVTLAANQTSTRLTIRSGPQATKGPVRLVVTGTAKIGANEVVRHAVPSEDKMQAFLWRHLVPASELPVVVFDRNYQPEARRPLPARPAPTLAATVAAVAQAAAVPSTPASAPTTTSGTSSDKPKFSKQQIAGRLRQLKLLYEEGLLSDDFYLVKVAECDVAQ